MFGEKCPKCDKRISKKHEFCAYCGLNLSGKSDEDYGFLGRNDFNDLGIKLPFGLKAMLKPLMKELNKQMMEIDKQMKKQQENNQDNINKRNVRSFNISFGVPGQTPVKFSSGPGKIRQVVQPIKKIDLPKISDSKLNKSKNLPRKEPETIVRRLGDSVIYEILLPNVESLEDVNVASYENIFEIKAISKDKVYVKNIDVKLPLKKYEFESERLILELGLK